MTNPIIHYTRPGPVRVLTLLSALACAGTAAPSVRWICSTETQRWQERTGEIIDETKDVANDVIMLDPQTKFQTIDGFGGCFNELGWEALSSLPADRREAALEALFSPDEANFTLGRAPRWGAAV